jgi:hypothetical protein
MPCSTGSVGGAPTAIVPQPFRLQKAANALNTICTTNGFAAAVGKLDFLICKVVEIREPLLRDKCLNPQAEVDLGDLKSRRRGTGHPKSAIERAENWLLIEESRSCKAVETAHL